MQLSCHIIRSGGRSGGRNELRNVQNVRIELAHPSRAKSAVKLPMVDCGFNPDDSDDSTSFGGSVAYTL